MTHKLALALALAPAAVLAQATSRAVLAQEPQESPYELKSQFASDGTPQEMFASGIDPGSSRALRLPHRSFADEEDPIQETPYELKSRLASDGTPQEMFASGIDPLPSVPRHREETCERDLAKAIINLPPSSLASCTLRTLNSDGRLASCTLRTLNSDGR